MIEVQDQTKCTGCEACVSVCPESCISMESDENGFRYPKVDLNYCINCNACIGLCPEPITCVKEPVVYAAYAKDEAIRLQSSSGGVFTVFAEYILDSGGVVVGAYLDCDLQVKHVCIERKTDLSKLRGSKYIQSTVGTVFKDVKRFLDSGRIVYFTGTSCQVHGLKNYLKNDYINLICQDMACNGVTSELLWSKYVEYIEKKYRSRVMTFNFRNKCSGWKQYSVAAKLENGKTVTIRAYDDLFMRAYKSKMFMRPSCYACRLKGIGREVDITLADYWGVEHIVPEIDDDKGISLLIVQSEKGRQLLERVKKRMFLEETNLNGAVSFNPALVVSVVQQENSAAFIEALKKCDFRKTVWKYCGDTFVLNLKVKTVRYLTELKEKVVCKAKWTI